MKFKNSKKFITTCLMAVLALSIAFPLVAAKKKSKAKSKGSYKQITAVLPQFYKEYEKNALRATKKWKGKKVSANGTVGFLGGGMIIHTNSFENFGELSIDCNVSENVMMKFSNGDTVDVFGEIDRIRFVLALGVTYIELENCQFKNIVSTEKDNTPSEEDVDKNSSEDESDDENENNNEDTP
ncbi:MAG TPA: hypothetical protein PLY93_11740 [Turneriella sp.]|nr:hypothetical protein [Turneriella sp.]